MVVWCEAGETPDPLSFACSPGGACGELVAPVALCGAPPAPRGVRFPRRCFPPGAPAAGCGWWRLRCAALPASGPSARAHPLRHDVSSSNVAQGCARVSEARHRRATSRWILRACGARDVDALLRGTADTRGWARSFVWVCIPSMPVRLYLPFGRDATLFAQTVGVAQTVRTVGNVC